MADLQGFFWWLFGSASAILAWCAIGILIALWYHVATTRRLTAVTESSLRSAQRPLLYVKSAFLAEDKLTLYLRNDGQGPALNISQQLKARSEDTGRGLPAYKGFAPVLKLHEAEYGAALLSRDGTTEIAMIYKQPARARWEDLLLLITAEDVAGNCYQTGVTVQVRNGDCTVLAQRFTEQLAGK